MKDLMKRNHKDRVADYLSQMDEQLDELEIGNPTRVGGTISATAGGDQTTIFAKQ
tara:strand:+ start:555 stop:719 length:165 start_codon:yes stop_codon:yes gene_type:complete